MPNSKDGDRLYRRIKVRIVFPEKIFPDKDFLEKAPARKGFTSENVFEFLYKIADRLEELYPWWDFKYTELVPEGSTARYVFNFAGYRKVTAAQIQNPQPTESSALDPATAESGPIAVPFQFREAGSAVGEER